MNRATSSGERPRRSTRSVAPLARQLAEGLGQRMTAPQLDVAIGAEQQQARGAQLAREELQQQEGRFVGPVQIVEDHHQRASLRGVAQQHREALEKSEARLLGIEARRHREAGQRFVDLGHQRGNVRGAGTEVGQQLARLAVLDPRPHHLHPGPERRRARRPRSSGPTHTSAPRMRA